MRERKSDRRQPIVWPDEDVDLLTADHKNGMPYRAIAERLHRPMGSVRLKIWELQKAGVLDRRYAVEARWPRA
jgi:hypothetical protein